MAQAARRAPGSSDINQLKRAVVDPEILQASKIQVMTDNPEAPWYAQLSDHIFSEINQMEHILGELIQKLAPICPSELRGGEFQPNALDFSATPINVTLDQIRLRIALLRHMTFTIYMTVQP